MPKTKIYHPIPGIGSRWGSAQLAVRSRIFQGQDHLLVVQSTGYNDDYKRIFFQDVQYVDVRPNQYMLWQAIISGVIPILFLLLYFASVPVAVVLGFSLPFIIWFVVNLILGPTCDCYIQTTVQTLKLPAPRRMKKVPALIEFLRAKTASLQPAPTEQPAI
jgi:hypothetical protein